MSRGLDHIVHAVRDLDAAAETYRRLGFTVGARNRHPRDWGTQNHIVQLPGTFIELLGMADGSGIVPDSPRHFSFGAFNRDFLQRHEGISMLALQGRGAADAAEFRATGLGDFELYDFEREGRRPDGTAIKLAFSLAFAADPNAPAAGFFTCLHRHPENFWNPEFQKHANGARHVAGVVLVADDPSAHRDFLTAFSATPAVSTDDGFVLRTQRGDIDIVTPRAFSGRYGVAAPDTSGGPRLAAMRLAVGDGAQTRIIGPQEAHGAALIFEPLNR